MTHDELNAALVLQRKINRLQAQLDDIRQTGGVGAPSDKTPVMGGSGGVFAGQIAAELEQEIEALQKKLDIEREIIRRYIDKLDLDDLGHRILLLRYVECRSWRLIGISLGYSERRIYQLRKTFERLQSIAVDFSIQG